MSLKKHLIPNIPYVVIGLFATNLGEGWRLAVGSNASEKLLHIIDGLALAFANPLPSFHLADLCIGVAMGGFIRLAVYFKGKNAKKYRKNMEYGSARWGTSADIQPYIDPAFENNIILTQTERLTMNNRPKDPKTARNKNVLIIGGSGSGKTRFWLKPNLMQCASETYPVSFVVTDPKGSIVVECGKLLLRKGYEVRILNTINFKKSMHYNPFAYLHSEKDILKLVTTLIANTKGGNEKNDRDFWTQAEALLYSALIAYIHYEAPMEEQNFSTLLALVLSQLLIVKAVGFFAATVFAGIVGVDSFLSKCFCDLLGVLAAPAQKHSTVAVVRNDFSSILVDGFELRNALQYDSGGYLPAADGCDELVEVGYLSDVGKLVQEQPHMNRQATTVEVICFIAEQVQQLTLQHGKDEVEGGIRIAHDEEQGCLSVTNGIQRKLIVGHEITQLLNVEGRKSCTTGDEDGFCRLACRQLVFLVLTDGKAVRLLFFQRFKHQVNGVLKVLVILTGLHGIELMSQDEIAVMDGGKCILQLRGVRPFFSDKYDITKHPFYKHLSDYHPKNAFDIERFLSTKLKIKPDDVYEVYEVPISDEEATAE